MYAEELQRSTQEIKRELYKAVDMAANVLNIDNEEVQDLSANYGLVADAAIGTLIWLTQHANRLDGNDVDDVVQDILDATSDLGSRINEAKQTYARLIVKALDKYDDQITKSLNDLEKSV